MVAVCTTALTIFIGTLFAGAVSAQLSVAASAGEATAHNSTSSAYEEAPPNLTAKGIDDHELGDEAFEEAFVLDPHSEQAGLGPKFNNASCVSCHIRNGRGMPEPGQLLLRVTDGIALNEPQSAAMSEEEKMRNAPPVLHLGNQIQDFSVLGERPEATVDILWQESAGTYDDGTPYRLRSPQFTVTMDNGELLPETVKVSPRIPPHVYGLGLLEAIPQEDIITLADPDDADGDGISGRPNWTWDIEKQEVALGRFGLKANSPNLLQQSADAYFNDMGVTSYLFPAEDGSVEVDDETLVAAAAYAKTLAVPARRLVDDPTAQQGERLFADANCASCHISTFKTGSYEYPALENQTIHPYTDLLLHDMGEGLADDRPDFVATGREWRTSSLWGVGLAQTVLPYSGYLHDGRARTFEEAILWHGGEAEASKQAFKAMSARDRDALVEFLESL